MYFNVYFGLNKKGLYDNNVQPMCTRKDIFSNARGALL